MKYFDDLPLEDLIRGVFRGGAENSLYYGDGYDNGFIVNPIKTLRWYRSLKPQIYMARLEIDLGNDFEPHRSRVNPQAAFPGDRRDGRYSYALHLIAPRKSFAGRKAFKLRFPRWVHPVKMHEMIELEGALCDYLFFDFRDPDANQHIMIRKHGEYRLRYIEVRLVP